MPAAQARDAVPPDSSQQWTSRRVTVLVAASLGLICLLLRVILWRFYSPMVWGDTGTYEVFAQQIQSLNLTGYLGMRTPGYPLLLLLAGREHHAVWIVQSLCGVSISLMLFALTWTQTHSRRWSFLIGLSSSLSLNLLFFEANILTESLSLFLVILSLLLLQRAFHRSHRGLYLAAVGGLLGLAALTRPQLSLLAPLYVVYCFYEWAQARLPWATRWRRVAGFTAPFALLVLGWCLFNQVTVNYFGLTTLTGYYLTDQSGAFIEYAPDQYATIRDIYLAYRPKEIARAGTYAGTIHYVANDMLAATGLSYSALSQELTRMSLELFVAHPVLYLRGVFGAWVDFWRVPVYWDPNLLRSTTARTLLTGSWWIERWLLIGANAVFLVFALYVLGQMIVRRRAPVSAFVVLIMAAVLVSSLFQAAVEHVENGRFMIPFQPLILYTLCLGVLSLRKSATAKVDRRLAAPPPAAPSAE
jgi:hypothetical protein